MSKGYLHSVEVGGFVDGPGVRYVVFLSGCPLRCRYCHNPDSWRLDSGTETSSDELLERIGVTASFLRASGGGVTISGGEPLVQAGFVRDVLAGAKSLGLHTAFDTSGFLGDRATGEILDATDLVLLDIKSFDPATYRDVTGVDVEPTLRFARRLAQAGKPTLIRYVLVPGLTDGSGNLTRLARFVATLGNVQRLEVLPFHQLGRHKWEQLGIPYSLARTPVPTDEELWRAREVFLSAGVPMEIRRPRGVPSGRVGESRRLLSLTPAPIPTPVPTAKGAHR